LIQSRPTVGSLAAYDEFEFNELHQFLDIYHLNIDSTITGNEPFSEVMLISNNFKITLPNNIYRLLVNYYNNTYDELEFILVTDLVNSGAFKN